jgi:hypothetical protein
MAASDKPSYEELEAQLIELQARVAEPGQRPERQRHAGRSIGIGLLLAISCLSLVVADLALWADRTIVSQQGYVSATSNLIQVPAIQTAIVQSADKAVTTQVNVPALVANVLPPNASFLVTPIAGQVTGAINTALTKLVASPQVSQVWASVNARVHQQLVHKISTYQGSGQINLSDIYSYLIGHLQNTTLQSVAPKSLPSQFGNITVLQVAWLPPAHDAYVTLQWALPVAIVVGILALAGAIWWSTRRRQTIIAASIAGIFSLAITVVVVRIARSVLLSNFHVAGNQAAASAVAQALINPLFVQTRVWFAVIALVAIITWVTSPFLSAVKFRSWFGRATAATYRATGQIGGQSPAIAWLRSRRRAVEWVLLAITLAALMVLAPLSLTMVGAAIVILAICVGLVEVLTSASSSQVTR